MKLLRTILLLITLLPLTACGLSSDPIEGQVLEAGTKKPLAGAIVVVRWEGTYSQIAESKTSCYHVETATTDGEGRYKIPGWWQMPKGPFFSPGAKDIIAYKAGYAEHWPAGYDRTADYKNNVRYLAPFKNTSGERFKYLEQMARASNCLAAGKSEKNLYPLYEALYFEAKNFVATEDDKRKLQWLREVAAEVAVGVSDQFTHAENEKRIEQFLREHLK